jgi:hypothetical protein
VDRESYLGNEEDDMAEEKGEDGGRGGDVRCGGYRVLEPLCVIGCSSVVWEDACVRDGRGIGWMGVNYRVDTMDYSVSGECGGGIGSRMKSRRW